MADNLNTTTTSEIEELDNPTDKIVVAFCRAPVMFKAPPARRTPSLRSGP